jgi:hypothetical protein
MASLEEIQALVESGKDLDVSPENPFWPDPANFHDNFTFEEIQAHFWLIRASCETENRETTANPTDWYFPTEPIAFIDIKEKKNWRNEGDMGKFHCFSHFLNVSREKGYEGQLIWVGLFVTKTQSWVANMTSEIIFHSWCAILFPSDSYGSGNQLVVYDCNTIDYVEPDMSFCHYTNILNMQQQFVDKFLPRAKRYISTMWMIGPVNGNPHGKCLELTSEWL